MGLDLFKGTALKKKEVVEVQEVQEVVVEKKDYFIVYSCFTNGLHRATGNASVVVEGGITDFDKVCELESMILADTVENTPGLMDVDCIKVTSIQSFPIK